MSNEQEMLLQLGAFEPHEATKVLPRLEAAGIEFEVEADNTEIAKPSHAVLLSLGVYPEGAKLLVFVPESQLDTAVAALKDIFPV